MTTVQMAKVIVQYLGRRTERLLESFEGLPLEELAHACRARGGVDGLRRRWIGKAATE